MSKGSQPYDYQIVFFTKKKPATRNQQSTNKKTPIVKFKTFDEVSSKILNPPCRTKILNLEEPLSLEFTEPVQEIMIILIPLGLARLGLKTNTINLMREKTPKVT